VLGFVLLEVTLCLAVEPIKRAVLEVGVDDHGLAGNLDALVGVRYVLHEPVVPGLPRVNALAGRFLILRIVVIGGAGTLAESLGVDGDAALVGDFHTGVDGFFASRPQFCSQIRELSVRVTQEGGNRLRLGLGILVLGEGDVEATVGGLRALPLPSRSYGYSVHVTSVGLLLLS